MTALDQAPVYDTQAMINDIYGIQATLTMLTEQLARAKHPDLDARMVSTLACMNEFMQMQQPSLRRH